MEEDEEDIYAPDESPFQVQADGVDSSTAFAKEQKKGGDLEEGEEEGEELEEEDSDSDIDIITERTDGNKLEPSQSQRLSTTKSIPVISTPLDLAVRSQPSPKPTVDVPTKVTPARSGASYPGIKTSKIDVDAKPRYEPNGKPITEIDMDADFPEDDKPWRRPGTDMTDYFNYGFDEFTWASYCLKQSSLRKEVADSKKQMDDMQNFLSMPGAIPTMPGLPGGAQPGLPPMGGPGDIPPEVQQMMAQMMAQGIDPMQMDPTMFMQQMGQGGGVNGNQGQNFAGAQGFSQPGQNQQQMGFGFGAAGAGGRNQGGRGQNRRNW